MTLKISLPNYVWNSIIKYGDYKEHSDAMEVILKAFFVPRVREFACQHTAGNVKRYKEYYKFVLEAKPCIFSDGFIIKVYELLEKEGLFLETKELEYLFSYSILVSFAEYMEKFYDKETGQTS